MTGVLGRLASPAKPTAEQLVDETARDLALAAQLCDPIIEAVAGYRAKCTDAGFAPDAAERMATDYHAGLLRLMLR